MSARHAYRTTMGATLLDPSRTLFRLWAPSCTQVSLLLDGYPDMPMQAAADGYFECIAPVGAGTRYRYRVGPDLIVPDPASRAQPDDVHGPSMVVDPRAFEWRSTQWNGRAWEQAVIYEVHVGIAGGFRALCDDLPRIAALGVTAIELMPLSEFPGGRNWGYDGVLPYAPESSYGTVDDLKTLVDTAHRIGLMVFVDVVYNHFGPDGNYLAEYAAPMFRAGSHTAWGAALDFTVPQVQTYFLDNALYWLMEFRFDGLRLDAVDAITPRDWLLDLLARVRDCVEPGRRVHLMLENRNNDADLLRRGFDAQWNDDGHNVLHVLLTGEHEGYYGNFETGTTRELATVLRDGFLFHGQVEPVTGLPRGSPGGDLPATSFILFLQNHDQIGNRAFGERLDALADPRALRVAYALLLLSPQIPMLFMGEEWGSTRPFLFFTSHHAALGHVVRDGRRKELAAFSHFSDPAVRETIPDPNDPATFEASLLPKSDRQSARAQDRINLTTHLLALRAKWVIPRLRGAHALDARAMGDSAVLARWRMNDGAVLTIMLNLGAGVVADVPPCADRLIYACPDEATHGGAGLPGYAIRVFMTEGGHG
ncbi:malto-oligosyltrehalose trehalohydrolase [Novacetimonas maltaceti]|uniref:Malto-oligosyltrehalose trehalohydrolase n=1 Tax=Novacetimonas maltaceti TaxID=1203393 RepID=A0A2S3W623_9PROT|nr:malto-oligosyltrehalose trehalohydrolase [Novacetimonas maltaceti]POF64321.1 Malto-oligosyltrehalose trehalohydrolase [Novacetimonas maltaceti]PYD61426.1 malto-oligosyltrehalose trehalohydrolase [Novacetimonas maltaceti]